MKNKLQSAFFCMLIFLVSCATYHFNNRKDASANRLMILHKSNCSNKPGGE